MMERGLGWVQVSLLAVALAACGSKTATGSAASPGDVGASGGEVGATTAGETAKTPNPTTPSTGDGARNTAQNTVDPGPPAPPKRERIRLHNSCSKPLKFEIRRVNDSDFQSTITNGNSIEERAADGDEVRLMGENNTVLSTLKIEASMQGVDFAGSCSKLEPM